MAIKFIPKPGMVLMCEFGPRPSDVVHPGVMVGPLSVAPEMIKKRFVIVMAPAGSVSGTCIVIPLSSVAPPETQGYHHCFPAGSYTFLTPNKDSWVKANMPATVSCARLDRVLDNGKYCSPSLSNEDFSIVKACAKHALGL